MAFVPQQDEGYLQLYIECLGERQGHGDQVAVVTGGIASAIGGRHGDQFVTRLGGDVQGLLETRDHDGHLPPLPLILQQIVQRPAVAGLPHHAYLGTGQKVFQRPRPPEQGVILAQEHHGAIGEQHLVIDVIGQPVDPGLGATMGLPGAEAEIRIPVDYVVEGVVIPPQHPDHRVGVLLVDGHGQLAQEADAKGGLHHQTEAGPLGDRLAVESSDAACQQEPGLELLLQGQGELGRLQPLPHPHQEGIVEPVPQLGERLAHRRGGDAELLGRP
ncbi:hypothetical protein D3C76_793160 [compost metagenome]